MRKKQNKISKSWILILLCIALGQFIIVYPCIMYTLESDGTHTQSGKFSDVSDMPSNVWKPLDTVDFLTERFYYANGGSGGSNDTCCWAMIGTQRNTGQWTYYPKIAKYGTYVWEGQYINNNNDAGWVLQGLVSRDTHSFVAFESRLSHHIFMTITYRNNLCYETKLDFNLSDTSFHKYGISWKEGNALFFIDDILVANHTINVPDASSSLYFHTQVGLPSKYDDNIEPLYGAMRSIFYCVNTSLEREKQVGIRTEQSLGPKVSHQDLLKQAQSRYITHEEGIWPLHTPTSNNVTAAFPGPTAMKIDTSTPASLTFPCGPTTKTSIHSL